VIRGQELGKAAGDIRLRVTQSGVVLEMPPDCNSSAREEATRTASQLAAANGRMFAEIGRIVVVLPLSVTGAGRSGMRCFPRATSMPLILPMPMVPSVRRIIAL
jgi:hypothetical protein